MIVSRIIVIAIAWAIWIVLRPPTDSFWTIVLGGVLTATAFALLELLATAVHWIAVKREIQMSFGASAFTTPICLTYATFESATVPESREGMAPAVSIGLHVATGTQSPGHVFRIDTPIAAHDIRGAIYIADALNRSRVPYVFQDSRALRGKFDFDGVMFGLGGSCLSQDFLAQLRAFGYGIPTAGAVDLMDLSNGQFLCLESSKCATGYIARLSPKQFPTRKWCLCGGVGGPGTSSAAFIYAKKRRLLRWTKTDDGFLLRHRDFIAIIRSDLPTEISLDKDESSEIVRVIPLQTATIVIRAQTMLWRVGKSLTSIYRGRNDS